MDNVYVDLRNVNKWIRDAFDNKDLVTVEDVLTKIEDLLDELDDIKEQFKDYKNDVESNYRYVLVPEQLDISDKDFI